MPVVAKRTTMMRQKKRLEISWRRWPKVLSLPFVTSARGNMFAYHGSLDAENWREDQRDSLRESIKRASPSEINALISENETWIKSLPPSPAEGIEPALFASRDMMPSEEMTRKRDTVLDCFDIFCSKFGANPLCPTAELITKFLLVVEHTRRWSPWSIKYSHLFFFSLCSRFLSFYSGG
jgi:hypothetical protein